MQAIKAIQSWHFHTTIVQPKTLLLENFVSPLEPFVKCRLIAEHKGDSFSENLLTLLHLLQKTIICIPHQGRPAKYYATCVHSLKKRD